MRKSQCQGSRAKPMQQPGPANGQLATSRFQEACARIQASWERFPPHEYESAQDGSEEEEDLQEDDILQTVFQSYRGSSSEDDPKELSPALVDALRSGTSVCLICIESIKRVDQIWSCCGCHCSFHLPCIQKWSKDSIFFYAQTIEDQDAKRSLTWSCPKCRKDYAQADCPSKYLCYCGKVVEPEFHPWQVPHSCGQICEKQLVPRCGHTCVLLCHPGACPPCPQVVRVPCHCGKQDPVTRRCNARSWSCSEPCGKVLSCGAHRCDAPCHPGECAPCPRKSRQKCLCGSGQAMRPCASPRWRCEQVCGKRFECGQHSCEVVCHAGDCGACPRSGKRACPCGKNSFELPCTEDVPTCGDTCDKMLECGFHRCVHACHYGECGKCLQMRTKRCRCGLKEKSVPCSKEFACEVKCKRVRDCGRHTCNRKCCDGNCSKCEQPCGKTLPCRNHKCASRCHQGPCYPCTLIVILSCSCGSTKRSVPCGRERATKPPPCSKPCRKPPDCHHEEREKHRCHAGFCPPCRQVCAKPLPGCPHACPSPCHNAVLTKMQQDSKRAGPWEPLRIRYELVDKPCPPCQVPVSLPCLGNHGFSEFPCSEARVVSCGKLCGRKLPCGNHSCSLECHQVEDAPDGERAGSSCRACEEGCSRPRPPGCTHPCPLACHPDPCPECRHPMRIACHCKLSTLYVYCNEWNAVGAHRDAMASCRNRCPKQLDECGHRCPLTCHPGPCAPREACKKRVSLRCPCKRIKKDAPCNAAREVALECDAACRQQQEEEERRRQEERERAERKERERQRKEVEEFLRRGEKKKKRQKQRSGRAAEEEGQSKGRLWTTALVVALFAAFLLVIANKQ